MARRKGARNAVVLPTVGFDAFSQALGTDDAIYAARATVRNYPGRDLSLEIIREKARRGVNMELGHETDCDEKRSERLLSASSA